MEIKIQESRGGRKEKNERITTNKRKEIKEKNLKKNLYIVTNFI